jgi:hypothetical protein
MTKLQLRNEDARIAYLATVYHLGRPGSELNPDTLQKHDLGLQVVHDAMLPLLGQAVVELDLSAFQILKLGQAIEGVTNELKQYGMADGRSAVPRFSETMAWLYPETKDEPGLALDIVGHAVMLNRRLGGAVVEARREVADAAAAERNTRDEAKRSRWKFWQRGS